MRHPPIRPFLPGLAAATLAACVAEPTDQREPDAVTEHLRIFVEPGVEPLCEGDYAEFEDMFTTIGEAAGINLDGEVVDFHYWALDPETGAVPSEAGCGATSQGCYRQSSDTVHATSSSWDHELAHAVINRATPHLSDYLDEAFAEAFTDFPTVFPYAPRRPSEQINVEDRRLISRPSGAHFVRWNIEQHGVPDFEELDGLLGTEAFERWTDESVEVAEARWFEESSFAYPSIPPCGGFASIPVIDDAFAYEAVQDCDSPSAHTWGFDVLGGCFQLDPVTSGIYRVEMEGSATIARCLNGPESTASVHHSGTFKPPVTETPPSARAMKGVDYIELEDEFSYRVCSFSSDLPARIEGQWVASSFTSP